jgi:outer membrane lipoprotein-sorting protein
MKKSILIFVLLVSAGVCFAGDANDINKTIEKLNQTAANLKNLTAEVEYTHSQPLFETKTIRTGELFYQKDANSSALRINFQTLKQDESKEQKYREEYIFDGRKLTRIDYQSKSVVTEQYAKDNNNIEPFELVQDYFPIIGLSKPQEMTQEFDITMNENVLNLIPKENSRYFKTYKQINITINQDINFPTVFTASTTDSEEITIKLNKVEISKPVKKEVFDFQIPSNFTQTQK